MKTATVIQADVEEHPQSGHDLLKVTVEAPYEQVGQECATTDIWGPVFMPAPKFGDSISWDGSHIWSAGVRWKKFEYDSPSNAALH